MRRLAITSSTRVGVHLMRGSSFVATDLMVRGVLPSDCKRDPCLWAALLAGEGSSAHVERFRLKESPIGLSIATDQLCAVDGLVTGNDYGVVDGFHGLDYQELFRSVVVRGNDLNFSELPSRVAPAPRVS